MTDCDRVRELIPWYVNGTLSSNEAAEVAGHIVDCTACRDDLANTVRMSFAIKGAIEDLPDVPDRVEEAIRNGRDEIPVGRMDLGSFLVGLSLGLSITKRGRPRVTSNLRLLGRQVSIYKSEEGGD